jgi:hypothetical protein
MEQMVSGMMAMSKQIVTALGVLALTVSWNAVTSEAATGKCKTEECACERALKQNTIEALEAFLRKYPHSSEGGKSACAALGVPSLDEGPGVSRQDAEQPEDPMSGDLSSGG